MPRHVPRPSARLLLALALAVSVPADARAGAALVYRPMMADLRESLVHFRVRSFTQDFRYGSDITDSTSTGGWELGVEGVGWSVGAGKILRAPLMRSMFGWHGPWRSYQLSASGLIVSSFDRIEAQFLNVNDYQFGGAFEAQWSGEGDAVSGATSFRRAVFTTRTGLYHRSSHVGDEYVARGDFGRNQTGPGAGEGLSTQPAAKRTVLSYEALQQMFALEWAPTGGSSTVRLYAGGELKVGISGVKPARFRSPAGQVGFEIRGAGNRTDLAPDPLSRWVNGVLGKDLMALSWFAAADLRLAKPFNFAGADNPEGEDEVWTPALWTDATFGREFGGYAGSWHGMVGVAVTPPGPRARLAGHELLVTLDWYRGYSPHGTFLDMRRSTHPRWYIVPGVTLTF